ncbi:putative protein kinase RLK-Pelle-PERK-1 family [Helianthus debilis subsp. tardiflorus]
MKVGFELGGCLFCARVAVKIFYPFRSFYVGSKEGNSMFLGGGPNKTVLPTLEGLHRRNIRCREFRKMWISGRQNGLSGKKDEIDALMLITLCLHNLLLLKNSQFLRSQPSTHPLAASPSLSNSIYSPDHGGVGNSRACNLLGEGGFGCVYKGLLADGREVAVKQLKIAGSQGEREFRARAEVEIISRVHHRHLVSLVGYCISEHQRLLVYQYVPNNTLHCHLHCEGMPVMDWATRIRVPAGAARGLAYLHEDCHPRIIHRDIKSSNILLDDNFDAQVADFGLANLAMDSNTHDMSQLVSWAHLCKYMAPEYASSGKLTEKSDVFSFGVVVLELITGRKPVDASQPLGDESLVEWWDWNREPASSEEVSELMGCLSLLFCSTFESGANFWHWGQTCQSAFRSNLNASL